MERNVTQTLACFVAVTGFDDLPSDVVHESKRLLLDVVGCALGSVELDKGRLAVQAALKIGGASEATILGSRDKVAAPVAAFANGELMHSLDYCALLSPNHISAYVAPAVLAVAEAKNASGKDLLAGMALSHEVASRVGQSMDSLRSKTSGQVAPVWGLGFNAFGASAGAAKLMGLDVGRVTHALGLAGFYAPVPSHNKFIQTPHGGGFAKYGPAGWTAQSGVTTAMLAELGYLGDTAVLDGEVGFAAMSSSKKNDAEEIVGELGRRWNLLRVVYKAWPCCGLFQSPLGAMTQLVQEHDIAPEDIDEILIRNEGTNMLARYRYDQLNHHVDAQFSLEYNIALVALRVPVGADWQKESNLRDPRVLSLMRRVKIEPYPYADETRHRDLEVEKLRYIERRPSWVQVRAKGRVFTHAAEYAKWLSVDNVSFRATDQDLAAKFRANVRGVLDARRTEGAIEAIMTLERGTTAGLIEMLSP